MGRSGYVEDCGDDDLAFGRWRGVVASATRGKRGQKLLRDLRDALDAMPVKRLAVNSFQADGGFCTLGALGNARGLDMKKIEPYVDHEWGPEEVDPDEVGRLFGIAAPLAQEIMFMNDEAVHFEETPEGRWTRMRAWVEKQIVDTPTATQGDA